MLSGCFSLGKSPNAVLSSSTGTPPGSSHAASALAIDRFTTLARSSAAVTTFRMRGLFNNPGIADLPIPENAQGLDAAVASRDRPVTLVAQDWMRLKGIAYCTSAFVSATPVAHSLFNPDVCGDGSSDCLPPSPTSGMPTADATIATARRLAFIAARNGWLSLVPPDSPAVDSLAKVYSQSYNGRPNGENDGAADVAGKVALCRTVIMAPQFWLGFSGKSEVIRRIALGIGQTLPDFTDMLSYAKGTLTSAEYVTRLQQASIGNKKSGGPNAPLTGYLAAIENWHLDWLGLRGQAATSGGGDFRNGWLPQFGHNQMGSTPTNVVAVDANLQTSTNAGQAHQLMRAVPLNPARMTLDSQVCENVNSLSRAPLDGTNGQPTYSARTTLQAFDPRTTMLIWEYYHPTVANRFEVAGAWVHENYLARYHDYLAQNGYLGGQLPSVEVMASDPNWCTLQVHPSPDPWDGGPRYYACKGRLSKPGNLNDFVMIDLADIRSAGQDNSDPTLFHHGDNGSWGTAITQSAMKDFKFRRVRRFSPSGEQNGMSSVKLFWSQQPVLVCNNLDRFLLSCPYRGNINALNANSVALRSASAAVQSTRPDTGYSFGSFNQSVETWDARSVKQFTTNETFADGIANPYLLNGFSCGETDPDALARNDEANGFPKGYNVAQYRAITGDANPAPDSRTTHFMCGTGKAKASTWKTRRCGVGSKT